MTHNMYLNLELTRSEIKSLLYISRLFFSFFHAGLCVIKGNLWLAFTMSLPPAEVGLLDGAD